MKKQSRAQGSIKDLAANILEQVQQTGNNISNIIDATLVDIVNIKAILASKPKGCENCSECMGLEKCLRAYKELLEEQKKILTDHLGRFPRVVGIFNDYITIK